MLAAETKCNHFIMGGGWNTEFWAPETPTERAVTDRAQNIWEFLETFGTQDPRDKTHSVDKRWAQSAAMASSSSSTVGT